MFDFLQKFNLRRKQSRKVLSHNQIDATVMSSFLGKTVLKKDFILEEDRDKALAPGVMWRRRRFLFRMPDPSSSTSDRPEGLCINEVTLDFNAGAVAGPALSADYGYLVDYSEIENAYWATTFAAGAIRREDGARESRLYADLSPLFYGANAEEFEPENTLEALTQAWGPHSLDPHVEALNPHFDDKGDGKFGVARYLPAFPASRLVQSSEDILAAANAGYFLNFPEEYDDGVSCLHQALGGHMVDGRLVSPPWIERAGILGFEDGRCEAGLFGPEEMVLRIGDLEPVPLVRGAKAKSPQGAVWRAYEKEREAPPQGAAQLAFTGPLLTKVAPAGDVVNPPLGGGLVYLVGKHAQAALEPGARSSIRVELRKFEMGTPTWMVSAGPFLVRNSKAVEGEAILAPENAGEFGPDGPPPNRFPFDIDKTEAPRTAFGVLPSGGLKIVVVDGRRSGEHSCGLTLQGLARLMQWVGCETAVNFDGGGSSVLAIEGADHADMLKEDSPYGVVNIPSDAGGRERIVPVMLVVKKKS